MSDADRLAELGLRITEGETGVEAVLDLGTPLLNPLAQRSIPSAVFALAENCLIALEPAEFVGLPPLPLQGVRTRSELEQKLAGAFQIHLQALQRQSSQLRALGFAGQVHAESLELQARVEDPPFKFRLEGDKRGQLRVAGAEQNGSPEVEEVGEPFDLNDFPNRAGFLAHLRALFSAHDTPAVAAAPVPSPIQYRELLERFGTSAWVPSPASIDLVVTLRARGVAYRFAATRVAGRTFRALLAGPEGKMWAEQFELDAFPGVASIAASALGLQVSDIELFGSAEER
jgi:hypothetical protein